MSILKTYKLAATAAFLFINAVANAQSDPTAFKSVDGVKSDWQPTLVRDGVYDRVDHINTPLVQQAVRENDIMWKKRVWREIDIREKQNMAFRYPGDDYTGGGYFIEIVLDAIKKGKVKAYSNIDDRFTATLSKQNIDDMLLGPPDTQYIVDPVTQLETMKVVRREFNPDDVTKYRLKEDWYIDRNTGRLHRQIIGIAPIIDKYNDDGSYRASQALFWLYYPEASNMFAQYEVFNPDNDMARLTWYEFFEGRYFASRIIKVSNPFDVSFKERGMSPLEALYEGQKATEMLFNKEHDMWVY